MYINKNKVLPPYVNSLPQGGTILGIPLPLSQLSHIVQLHFWLQLFFNLLISQLLLDIYQLFLLDCVGLHL